MKRTKLSFARFNICDVLLFWTLIFYFFKISFFGILLIFNYGFSIRTKYHSSLLSVWFGLVVWTTFFAQNNKKSVLQGIASTYCTKINSKSGNFFVATQFVKDFFYGQLSSKIDCKYNFQSCIFSVFLNIMKYFILTMKR